MCSSDLLVDGGIYTGEETGACVWDGRTGCGGGIQRASAVPAGCQAWRVRPSRRGKCDAPEGVDLGLVVRAAAGGTLDPASPAYLPSRTPSAVLIKLIYGVRSSVRPMRPYTKPGW